jgi:hypothetical protein
MRTSSVYAFKLTHWTSPNMFLKDIAIRTQQRTGARAIFAEPAFAFMSRVLVSQTKPRLMFQALVTGYWIGY